MEECLVASLKLCGLGLRLYILLMVLGSMECKTCCLWYTKLVESNMTLRETQTESIYSVQFPKFDNL